MSQKKKSKQMDISLIGIVDNIVFSKSDAWAYYKLTNRAFDFLTEEGQASLIQKLTNAFNALMQDKEESLECHLIVTHVPVDVDLWREQIETISQDWNRPVGYKKYMDDVTRFLHNKAYNAKVVYLGVNLGKRGALNMDGLNIFELGFKGALETVKEWGSQALAIPSEAISEQEERVFRAKEQEILRKLKNGHLRATPCDSEELLLMIKRQFYPAMPSPYLDVDHESRLGSGDLALEASSVVENHYRWLKISQVIDDRELTGYRCTLSMTKFPRVMEFPGSQPFFYFMEKLGLPFTTFSRFELRPTKKMMSELEKKKKEQRDEIENLSMGSDALDSVVSGTPTHVRDALADSQMLAEILEQDKTAWVVGSYFLTLEAPDEKVLREYVSAVKQYFADLEININWTAGDQAQLFLSQMPGDKRRIKSFDQVTTLNMLPSSGFNFSSEVGDPIYGTSEAI